MAISSVGSPGLTINPRLPANPTTSGTSAPDSTTSTGATLSTAAASASGTTSLSNQLSQNLQAYLLQLQSAATTNVSTGATQRTDRDGGRTEGVSGAAQTQRRQPRNSGETQETGSPEQSQSLASGGAPTSASAAAGSPSLNAGGSILAALQAYASASGENQQTAPSLFA